MAAPSPHIKRLDPYRLKILHSYKQGLTASAIICTDAGLAPKVAKFKPLIVING